MSNDIKEIKVIYEDGTEKTIEKGFVSNIHELENEEIEAKFYFANISGKEISTLIMLTMQLGYKLGILNDEQEE